MRNLFTQNERDIEIKRLLYNSWHRGCKETDLYLGNFAREHLAHFSDGELVAYAKFLEEDDWDIFNWLTNKAPFPEQHQNSAIDKLRNFSFTE